MAEDLTTPIGSPQQANGDAKTQEQVVGQPATAPGRKDLATAEAAAAEAAAAEAPAADAATAKGDGAERLAWIGPLVQMICLVVLPGVFWRLYQNAPFVAKCPTQYAAVVLAVLLAGLWSAAASCLVAVVLEDLRRWSRLFLVLAIAPVGWLSYLMSLGSFDEGRIDVFAGWTLILSLLSALASLLESKRAKALPRWREIFLLVDLPLFVICLVVVCVKFAVYDWSSDRFNTLLSVKFPRPAFRTPESEVQQAQLLAIVKDVFWVGFSAGVVTVQLVVGQLLSVILRVKEILQSSWWNGVLLKTASRVRGKK